MKLEGKVYLDECSFPSLEAVKDTGMSISEIESIVEKHNGFVYEYNIIVQSIEEKMNDSEEKFKEVMEAYKELLSIFPKKLREKYNIPNKEKTDGS